MSSSVSRMVSSSIGGHQRAANIELDSSLIDPPSTAPPPATAQPNKKRKYHLSHEKDKLYADIADLNFAVVGGRLSRLAKRLEGDYGGVKNLKSVTQMKEFVGKLGGLQSEQQSLRLRMLYCTRGADIADTGVTEQLMTITRTDDFNKVLEIQQNLISGYDTSSQLTTIEHILEQEAPWTTVLRCIVLMSLTSGGIKPKQLEGFKRDFLQTYGYHHLPLLIQLQALGLLVRAPADTSFAKLRKPLRLVVDDIDDSAPNDISYVYSGYAPLSIRLVQCVTSKSSILAPSDSSSAAQAHPISGWKGFEDVLGQIPGATVDFKQKGPKGLKDSATKTTVVFFLGGCTYTEVSALRWMSKREKGRKYLIATTGMINGATVRPQVRRQSAEEQLLETFGDKPPVPLNPTQ